MYGLLRLRLPIVEEVSPNFDYLRRSKETSSRSSKHGGDESPSKTIRHFSRNFHKRDFSGASPELFITSILDKRARMELLRNPEWFM